MFALIFARLGLSWIPRGAVAPPAEPVVYEAGVYESGVYE